MDSKQLLDMNTIIQQIYDTDNKLFWQITHHYAKQLNNEEKQELIYYSIYKAINRYGLLDDDIKVDIDTILNEYTLEGDLVLTPPQLLYKSEED